MDGELEDLSFDDEEAVDDFKVGEFWIKPTSMVNKCMKCNQNRTMFMIFNESDASSWVELKAYDYDTRNRICVYCGFDYYKTNLEKQLYMWYVNCFYRVCQYSNEANQNILTSFCKHDPLWKQHKTAVLYFLLCWKFERSAFPQIPRDVALIIAKKTYYDF